MKTLNTNKENREARKICAFCFEPFKEQDSKTMFDGKYYHLLCYEELRDKVNR